MQSPLPVQSGRSLPEPRSSLYSPDELYRGFRPDDPATLGETLDGATYLTAIRDGQRNPASSSVARARALHDSSITSALAKIVLGRRPVGVMGGTVMERGSEAYRMVAEIACELTRSGFLVITGGGPGAMEAAHLGARLSNLDRGELHGAIDRISADPATRKFPIIASQLVRDDAYVTHSLELVGRWLEPALELAEETRDVAAESIGIPTWLYGHEPSTPLATLHAKYFENSIREDGLLALAVYGVVFAPGSAGTLQEVFQDAAQNFYDTVREEMSPMVFLDLDGVWTERFSIRTAMKALFTPADYEYLHFVTTATDAVAGVTQHDSDVHHWARGSLERKLL